MPVCGVSAARQPFLGILSEDVDRTGHIGRFLVVSVSRGCTSGHFFVFVANRVVPDAGTRHAVTLRGDHCDVDEGVRRASRYPLMSHFGTLRMMRARRAGEPITPRGTLSTKYRTSARHIL